MENKLVFEPTTLTQYQWNKYRLIENRTYKWDKYEAIPDYLYTYYWKKYVAVPPGPTNQWDTYEIVNSWPYEYDENIVLQNCYYNSSVQAGNRQANFLRVLRNQNVVNDNGYRVSNYTSSGGSGVAWAEITINNQAKGAYLFLTPAVDWDRNVEIRNQGNTSYLSLRPYKYLNPNYIPNDVDLAPFKSKYKKYIAKSLKDITQKTNLVDCHNIFYDSLGNKRTENEAKAELTKYVDMGYKYYFCIRPTLFAPSEIDNPNNIPASHEYAYDSYDNGYLLGTSLKVYEYLHNQNPTGTYEAPYNNFGGSRGVLDDYTGVDCQFNDCLWPYYIPDVIGSWFPHDLRSTGRVLSYIGILGSHQFNLVYSDNRILIDSEAILCPDYANLCMAHNFQYNHHKTTHYLYTWDDDIITPTTVENYISRTCWWMKYFAVNSSGWDRNSASFHLVGPTQSAFSAVSTNGDYIGPIYNTNPNAHTPYGLENDMFWIFRGEVYIDAYSAGDYIEEVSSNESNTYPTNGRINDYYYIYQRSIRDTVSYQPGTFIEKVYSSSNTYPQNSYYPNNLTDTTHYWYRYLGYDSTYERGNFISVVSSFIETAYPNNSYVLNDAWYVSTGSSEVIVGELIIDRTKLMGGVNYTQEINPSEDLMIGAGGAAQVDFTIYAPDAAAATQYLGKDFTYYVKMTSNSDWRQIGVFTLTKAELPDKQTAKIEGFDYIYKFDVVIDEWLDGLTFPMTLGNLFNSLCEYVGCEAYSTEFNNSDFIVNDNFEAVQITGRTILQYITEVSGGFCVAEPDGRIHIKQYSIPPTGTINLGNDSYVKYTHEIYNVPVITSVVVRKDDEDEGVESNV